MKFLKKILPPYLALCLVLLASTPVQGAHSQIIQDIILPIENVTSGVTLKTIKRFTTDGWLNINIVTADLSNPYIKVDAITSRDTAGQPSNTKNMAASAGAVAAVNASFFTTARDPVGLVVKSGSILTADTALNKYTDTYGALLINNMYQAFCSYWKTFITLTSQSGQTIQVARYNKPHYYDYNDLTIQDRKMYTTSLGTNSPASYPDFTEMVVIGGIVSEIRIAKPTVQIPENGYVVIASKSEGRKLITQNFKVGDTVSFSMGTLPSSGRIQTGLTGGSLLVKDGNIPSTFPHIPEGKVSTNNPRTAAGTSKDGKKLIMVTVDGRQKMSTGLTLYDLAVLMKQFGCYNAVNFDGGGSTTMVTRKEASQALQVVNSPSDGSLRNVATSLGIFSIAPPGPLEGLIVETVDKNIFVNTSREFTVRGYDRYLNPIAVNQKDVKWSVSGSAGRFEGNRLFPTTEGKITVTASIGSATGSTEVNVLSRPVELDLGVRSLNLATNQSKIFGITGRSKDGYYANINYKDVTWSVKGDIGEFKDNIFYATGQGTGYIDAAAGSAHAYCGISVPVYTTTVKDDFEAVNGYYTSFPTSVSGGYEISTEQSHSGKNSGKLTYDFSGTEGTRIAYFYLANGMKLNSDATKIGVYVYNDHINTNQLRAEILDANGKVQYASFAGMMDWTGWKYVELPLTNIALPATLYSIHTLQTAPVSEKGSIYFDDLTLTSSSLKPLDMTIVPQNTIAADQDNVSVVYVKSPESFRFSVFGMAQDPRNTLEKNLLNKLTDKINKYIEVGAFVGSKGNAAASGVNKPVVAPNNSYKTFTQQNSRFIQLDMADKSLIINDRKDASIRYPNQWNWLSQTLASAKEDNLFVFLANSPANFTDSAEAQLLKDILTKQQQDKGQNIWVFYGDSKNTSYSENGIKYMTSAGFDTGWFDSTNTANAKYILVVVKGKTITYEYKPIES